MTYGDTRDKCIDTETRGHMVIYDNSAVYTYVSGQWPT